jgi:hypothetical protein
MRWGCPCREQGRRGRSLRLPSATRRYPARVARVSPGVGEGQRGTFRDFRGVTTHRRLVVRIGDEFLLLPLLFLVAHGIRDAAGRRGDPRGLALLLAAAVCLQLPFIAYTYASFGSPLASTSGTVLWSGYLQGKTGGDTASVDAFKQAALAGTSGGSLLYARRGDRPRWHGEREVAGAFRDVQLYQAAADRTAQLAVFVTLNESLQARAMRLIAHDPTGYVLRGFTVRSVGLWAGNVPLRFDDAAALSQAAHVAIAAVELVIFFAGLIGVVILVRRRALAGTLVAGTVLYVWLVSIPFLTEGRYALPARPFLLIAIVAAAIAWSDPAVRRVVRRSPIPYP